MPPHSMALIRTIIGLLQGAGLYVLYLAAKTSWPATDPLIFAPLFASAIYVPLLVIVALGHLRPRVLAGWAIVALAICAGFAWYDVFRGLNPRDAPILSTLAYLPALGVTLFITHALVAAGETDRRFIANYPTYFDVSWKQAVQLLLAGLFVGTLWLLLWLGTELFRLIKIEFLADLIKRPWFWIPVTTLATSYALHVTDVRAALVQGVRTLKLTLLSWLLLIMTALAVAFVLALPFTGLEVLWSTRRATAILLTAVAALVFLINAAYQDGQMTDRTPRLLVYARTVAALVIVPFVVLAGYGLFARVQQYGWTPQRVVACACAVVAAGYAAGYVLAAMRSPLTMNWIERTNIGVAWLIVAAIISLFSPIADPARIAVADQLSRLHRGVVTPDEFDFKFLRFDSGRYGRAALDQLAAATDGPLAMTIARRAKETLALQNRFQTRPAPQLTAQDRIANMVVHPTGAALPSRFAEQDWSAFPRRWQLPPCLTATAWCDAFVVDLNDDGKPEILLFARSGVAAVAFTENDDGTWRSLGTIANLNCSGVRDALKTGRVDVVTPAYKDISAGNHRLRIQAECTAPNTSP
jgi:hypothetical protein